LFGFGDLGELILNSYSFAYTPAQLTGEDFEHAQLTLRVVGHAQWTKTDH